MQESANYINTLQRSQCGPEDNGDCTVARTYCDARHNNEQHVPSRYDDMLCSVSSSSISSSSSHNVPATYTNYTSSILNSSTLYSNSSATNIEAKRSDHEGGYVLQTYDVTPRAIDRETSSQHVGVATLDNQQTANTLGATVPYSNVSPMSYSNVSPVSVPTPPPPPPPNVNEHPKLDDGAHCQFLRAILEIVSRAVRCAVCQCTFNANVICSNYTIKLNRPIQCACGCVICYMCYTKDRGCRTHKLNSHRATVNVTANQLANATDVKWDLELDSTAVYRAERDCDVQSILHLDRGVPTADELKRGKPSGNQTKETHAVIIVCDIIYHCIFSAFQWLIDKQDELAFKYWDGMPMPELTAYRYVCISHTPGFWDHIILNHRLANVEGMLEGMFAADELTPNLFDVNMFGLSLHWCCFVFETQTILAMWCSARTDGQLEVLPITDRTDARVKGLTSCDQFNSMLYYLHRWLRVHYGKGEHQIVQVVFDCMPSESLTFAHFISMLAAKIGLGVTSAGFMAAGMQRGRPQTDLNYTIDTRYPESLFRRAPTCFDGAGIIDITREFGYHGVSFGMTQLYTNNDHSIYT